MIQRTNSTVTISFIVVLCIVGILSITAFYEGSTLWCAGGEEKEYILKYLIGTLSINFPEMKLLGLKYWIYLDGQIQNNELSPNTEIKRSIDKDGYIWLDEHGVAARMSDDWVVNYIRDDAVRGKLYKRLDYVLIPGEYIVEIAAESRFVHESDRAMNSPFTFIKHKVKIEAGKKTTLDLKLPRILLKKEAVLPEKVSPTSQTEHENIEKDRLVKALINCYNVLQYRPPIYRNLYIDLPKEYGGSRYFDATQVRIMVDFLKNKYVVWPEKLSNSNSVRYYSSGYSKQCEYLEDLNSKLDMLYEIGEKLEKVEE